MTARDLHRLARFLRELALRATADAGDSGISAGDLAIVEDVAHHSGTSIGAIAQRTGLAQSLVSKTVATMRDAGVFAVRPDPGDRRRVVVSVSSQSRDTFRARGDRPIEPALRELRPNASDADVERVAELLDQLAQLLR